MSDIYIQINICPLKWQCLALSRSLFYRHDQFMTHGLERYSLRTLRAYVCVFVCVCVCILTTSPSNVTVRGMRGLLETFESLQDILTSEHPSQGSIEFSVTPHLELK